MSTIVTRKIEVDFICVEVLEEKKLCIHFDPDTERETGSISLEDLEEQTKYDSDSTLRLKNLMRDK